MPFISRISDTISGKAPLKYATGAEVVKDVVVDYSVVTADSYGRKLVVKGEVLTRITATGKFGPYDATAEDGRATVAAPTDAGVISTVISAEDADVQLGDHALGGYYHNCVFDYSELTRHSATRAGLKAALPTCTLDD